MADPMKIALGGAPEGFDARLVGKELAKGQTVIVGQDAAELALALQQEGLSASDAARQAGRREKGAQTLQRPV